MSDAERASEIIERATARLQGIRGVEALVLGGSRARGTHTATSDVDLGIYYTSADELDLTELASAAQELDDEHRPDLLTSIGGWGPWINGGGWLMVGGLHVDFLYRDLGRVARIVDDCHAGKIEIAYQPGHPQGFVSSIYMAEAALCQPLWEKSGQLTALKAKTQPYPPQLKRAIINAFWWEADFSLQISRKAAERADVTYAAGCFFRAVTCLTQTLFALNEQYWMNEKGSIALADGFALGPMHLRRRVELSFTQLAAEPAAIQAAMDSLQALLTETTPLVAQAS